MAAVIGGAGLSTEGHIGIERAQAIGDYLAMRRIVSEGSDGDGRIVELVVIGLDAGVRSHDHLTLAMDSHVPNAARSVAVGLHHPLNVIVVKLGPQVGLDPSNV